MYILLKCLELFLIGEQHANICFLQALEKLIDRYIHTALAID